MSTADLKDYADFTFHSAKITFICESQKKELILQVNEYKR